MIPQFPSPSPAARLSRFALLSALFLSSSAALAKGDALPPRSQWKATGSSLQVPALAAAQTDTPQSAVFEFEPLAPSEAARIVNLTGKDNAQALWSNAPARALQAKGEAAGTRELDIALSRPLPWQVLAEVVHSRLRYPGYLDDMPHTWIGAEYARTIFGMLAHENDDRLALLLGTPPSWVAGEGLKVEDLPTL